MNDMLRWLLNLPPQGTDLARRIDYLHYAVISITMFGAFVVFLTALVFIVRFREKKRKTPTPFIVGNARIEAVVIGGLLSLFIAIWVVGFHQYLELEKPPADAMEVYVTAKQWMWKFAYPGGQSSVGVLFVPQNRAVKLLITSRDVIHSFYVPAFRLKQDAVPGRYTTAWFDAQRTGTYQIRCAEYCGTLHSAMLADVVVLPPDEYEKWLANPVGPVAAADPAPPTGESVTFDKEQRRPLVSRGEQAASDAGCLRCHTLDGTPHIGPTWSGLFGKEEKLEGGATVKVDEAYLTESMMDPMAKIVAGYQPVMPTYQGRIDPVDTAAIVEFIKTLHPGDARSTHPNPLPGNTTPPNPNPGGEP